MGSLKLLLDTCTFVWLTSSPAHLSPIVQAVIDAPTTHLVLSDCCVWEIALKWQSGKLQLPKPPRLWLEEQARIWKLHELRISRDHLYRVTELAAHHKDPFDRLLVAQAIEEGLTLVSPDPWIARYPVSVVW